MECISMTKFLILYKSFYNKNVYKLRHKDIAVLFPDLEVINDVDIRKDPDLLLPGRSVLVSDGREPLLYKTPVLANVIEDTVEVDMDYEEFTHDPYDFKNMENFELKKVCKDPRNTKRDKSRAKQELVDRGVVLRKKYKREKYRYVEGEE